MIITVRVKPHARVTRCVEVVDHRTFTIALRAPATEGKANDALVAFLANALDVPKTAISIVKGYTSKQKRIELPDGADLSRLST